MVRNEGFYLRKWADYYVQFFPQEDMYIMDHLSDDGSVQEVKAKYPGVRVARLEGYNFFDDVYKVSNINQLQGSLLERYENVVYTDCDELLWVETGLDKFLETNTTPHVKCDGYELIQKIAEEPALDVNQPILSQRRYWEPSGFWYSKSLIVREPLVYSPGLHLTTPMVEARNKAVKLIHIHKCDYGLAFQKNLNNQKIPRVKTHDMGGHAFINDPVEFRAHFFSDSSQAGLKPIPQAILDSRLF